MACYLRRVQARLLLLLVFVSLLPLGCGSRDDDGPGAAAPLPTMIPMGAPGAEGAQFDPVPLPKPTRRDPIEHKIDEPPADPLTPPSPFGAPPNVEEGPVMPPPPNVKKKGTQI